MPDLPIIPTPSINNLAQSALSRLYQIPQNVRIVKQQDFQIPYDGTPDPELYRSLLGTPVYTNIEFMAGQYESNVKGVFKQFGPLRFEAVIITVSQAKKIIQTEIQGRDGTVKEYIGLSDFEVQVNGIITGENGQHPSDEVIRLKRMLDAPIPIRVASNFLQNLEIYELVVSTYNIDQDEGGFSYQRFAISFISDVPQELRLTSV